MPLTSKDTVIIERGEFSRDHGWRANPDGMLFCAYRLTESGTYYSSAVGFNPEQAAHNLARLDRAFENVENAVREVTLRKPTQATSLKK